MAGPRPRILLVEDNPGDAGLLREAIADDGLSVEIETIASGLDALERLERAARGFAPAPDLMVLDLNLPGLYGHELLSRIRDHERLDDLAVVILTSSDDPEEAEFCRARGVEAFLIKPMGMDGYRGIVRVIAAAIARGAGAEEAGAAAG